MRRGYPKVSRGYHGTEFLCAILLEPAVGRKLHNLYIEPGKPLQSG